MSDNYTQKMIDHGVPEHLHDGLRLYLEHGVPPGSFLLAVLTNDLFEAMGRADEESRRGLFNLVSFIYHAVPTSAWGTAEKVRAFMSERRAERDAAREEAAGDPDIPVGR